VASSDTGTVSRYSPHIREVIVRVPVGDSPAGLTPYARGIWVVNRDDDTLVRISPVTNRVTGRPIEVGDEPTGVGWAHQAVWVTNSGDDTLVRVDPRKRRVVETIKVGDHPMGLGISRDSIWVANFEDDTVQRVDIATNKVIATVSVGDGPNYPRVGRTVWVPNSRDGTVSRIDPATSRLIGKATRVGQTADRVAVGVQSLWVTSYADQTLTRLQESR
jgi:serine/threonine-protein kinase